jgi:hypothetical protein
MSAVACLCTLAVGQQHDSAIPAFSLWGRFTMGEVVKSQSEPTINDYDFEREWLKSMEAGLRLTKPVGTYSLGRLHLAAGITFPLNKKGDPNAEFSAKRISPVLLDATFQSTFGLRGGRDTLMTELGYFPFKYNPQSTNLGEYLFRTGTYPGYIVSGFEQSIDKPKLCGLHLAYLIHAAGLMRHDVLLNTEMDVFPLHDVNFSYIFTYTPHPFLEIGAGVEAAHLISVDERKTTPGSDRNLRDTSFNDDLRWVGYRDSVTGEAKLYTFRGTKVMARFCLDPKRIFNPSVLGAEDLKLYAEAVILGVRNYPGWYENREERIPVMFGINLPTFKLLDVLSIEGEWYPSKYWNSQENIWKARTPVPYTGSSGPDLENWQPRTDDDWKWSIYMSRKFNNIIRVSFQAASDHLPRNMFTPGPPSYVKYTEVTPRTEDWYFMGRLSFYF